MIAQAMLLMKRSTWEVLTFTNTLVWNAYSRPIMIAGGAGSLPLLLTVFLPMSVMTRAMVSALVAAISGAVLGWYFGPRIPLTMQPKFHRFVSKIVVSATGLMALLCFGGFFSRILGALWYAGCSIGMSLTAEFASRKATFGKSLGIASRRAESHPPPGPSPLPKDLVDSPPHSGPVNVSPVNVVASDELDYSFSVAKPGWIRMDPTSEEEYGANVALQHDNLEVMKVMVSDWQLSFEDLCRGIEEAYKQEAQQYRRIAAGRTTVAGLPAICFEYEGVDPDQNQPMRWSVHAFLKGQTVYQFFAIGNPLTFDVLKQEAVGALQSFSFDPVRAGKYRGAFPRRQTPWWQRLDSRPGSLPGDVQAVLFAGAPWAIGGALVGMFLSFNALSMSGGFFGKLVIFLLWTFAGAFVGASFRWGQIGAYSGKGHKALDVIVQVLCLPFYPVEFRVLHDLRPPVSEDWPRLSPRSTAWWRFQ